MRNARGLALMVAFTAMTACGGQATPEAKSAASGANAPLHPVNVSEAELGPSAARLLQNKERSPERTDLLVGVVKRQLKRAAARFRTGHREEGFTAVVSALHLVRVGEYHPEMIRGGESAILQAAEHVSQRGNEGQALALYSMVNEVLPQGATRRDVSEHLDALASWREATRSEGTLQAAGDDQRVLVDRALLEPRAATLDAARNAMVRWVSRAIAYSKEQMPPTNPAERDEAIEAYRAVRTGALALAALYLRFGDAQGALAAVDGGDVGRVVSPNLQEALRRAGDDNDPEAWFELFRTFDSFVEATDAEVPLDQELARAASWGSALELYRAEPESMRGIMPITTWLLRNGLSEAAIPLMEPALNEEPDARVVSWVLSFVLQSIVNAEATDDADSARRLFTAAQPFIKAAQHPKLAAEVTPSPARLRYVMGAIEARSGELGRARGHLVAATTEQPTIPALRMLAAIDRQRGAPMEALKSLDTVLALAGKTPDPAEMAEAHLDIFEIQRDLRSEKAAETALESALRRALEARGLARTGPEQASAERILARVLEYYRDFDGARRATQRAYEASRNDVQQLTVTVLDASRRALTRGDLTGAREAARRAVEANLPPEDVVYIALWLKLVEARLKVPSDGTKEEAFASISDDAGWAAKLRAWGNGKLGDEALFKAAGDRVEQTEALFYSAMAMRAQHEEQKALQQLKRVAESEAIQLVEVTIARDLIAQQDPLKLELPKDVSVP